MLGHTPIEISQQIEHSTAYIKQVLGSRWASTQLRNFHDRFMSQLQQRAFDHTRAFADKLAEKITLLDDMTKSDHPPTALKAIDLWISHTVGSPVKRTEVKHEHSLSNLSKAELEFVRTNRRLPSQEERLMLEAPPTYYDVEGQVIE